MWWFSVAWFYGLMRQRPWLKFNAHILSPAPTSLHAFAAPESAFNLSHIYYTRAVLMEESQLKMKLARTSPDLPPMPSNLRRISREKDCPSVKWKHSLEHTPLVFHTVLSSQIASNSFRCTAHLLPTSRLGVPLQLHKAKQILQSLLMLGHQFALIVSTIRSWNIIKGYCLQIKHCLLAPQRQNWWGKAQNIIWSGPWKLRQFHWCAYWSPRRDQEELQGGEPVGFHGFAMKQ